MTVNRFSTIRFDKSVQTNSGGLKIDAAVSSAGVFPYLTTDGKTRWEYRPPEEVLKADSLASLTDVAVTLRHPPGLVDARNWKQFAIGHQSGPVSADGDKAVTTLIVSDAKAIADIAAGKLVELSGGYSCDLEASSGVTPEGIKFDAVQRNIRYNHVGIGPRGWGRQGSTVSLRLDSSENEIPIGPNMIIKLDGKDVEAGSAEHLQIQARLDATKDTECAALKARADKAEAERDVFKTKLEAAPALLKAELQSRALLEASAKPHLGDEKLDALKDNEIRAKVISKLSPALKIDGREAVYIEAVYETLLATAKPNANAEAIKLLEGVGKVDVTDEYKLDMANPDVDAAARNANKRNQNLWKQGLNK